MPRPRRLLLALTLTSLGCTPTVTATQTSAPTLATTTPTLRPTEIALPFHSAAIVDLALLPPRADEQWRLASGDADGWVRIWANGKLLAASRAHPGGLAALQVAPDGVWYTAGFDGRVLEWPAHATQPSRAFTLGNPNGPSSPITAMAVAGPHLVVSDGHHIQMWTREPQPQLVWSMVGHAFVTGLALSPSGGVIAAAELRQWALREGIATHPLASFDDGGMQAVPPEEQAALRAAAALDFPGAAADYVEVWQPSQQRARQLVPSAPIDSDLGVVSRGGVIYREIYDRNNAGLIGRRLEDQAHYPLALVKPWAFWTDASGNPTPASTAQPNLPTGDFALGPKEEVLILDHFPGWAEQPPERGWRAGENRELAIDHHHAAIGDGLGNLAVVAWARPAEAGWMAPAEEHPDLLAGASGSAQLVTATLEPRTSYRLWSLDAAGHRSIRVEAPWQVLPSQPQEGEQPVPGPPVYPFMIQLDAQAQILTTSATSYGETSQALVRVLRVPDGAAQVLGISDDATSLDIGLSPDGSLVLAWAPGAAAQSWLAPGASLGWTAGPDALAGAPRFSANGLWSAHVSSFERHIVDLHARKPVVQAAAPQAGQTVDAGTLAAIANDGTLAVVQPFGGGTLERIDTAGTVTSIELPGAATTLAWVPLRDADPTLVIGFLDGSIARLDRHATEAVPIHAGEGGRVWELAVLGGTAQDGGAGVFVELDDRGLTIHRLVDDATVDLYVADTTALARWVGSSEQALRTEDLVAVWRPGTAMPVCRILDGTSAGVLAAETVERWPLERGPEFFAQFFAGANCGAPSQPPPDMPDMPAMPATTEPEASPDTSK
ncbi:hypothetical protein DB30_06533 [Enhygromyxa salina]|uniref:WD domain, G-beta repeat n=1 Tax=Enhygromyxa salina TaxID=215803 RepID=A0A0C2DGX3_9BACT|nr:hypothetical protein [Enhygromyxa salina]KIG18922.1 hypothetical protein DB30_06533 [Enhygromyxa salina]